MIKHTKKERLDEVKDYINEELSNPFCCEVKVTEDNGNIIVDCGCWVLKMGIGDDWFNVSTRQDLGLVNMTLTRLWRLGTTRRPSLKSTMESGMMTVNKNDKHLIIS